MTTDVATTTAAATGTGEPGPDIAVAGHPGTLTGTGRLVRLFARLDRVRIVLWVAGIGLLVLLSAVSVADLYPTEADLREAAALLEDNAAMIALQGPTYAIDTLGGQIVYQIGSFGYVIMALMGMFLTGRHTRADEEQGLTELVRSAVVGRDAPLAAALLVASAALVVVGGLVTLSMLAVGLGAEGALAYGAAMALYGVVFACVTAVAAQVTEHTRTAYGLTGAVLGAAFLARAVGDIGGGTLSWLSPMGWAQSVRPYAGERWWALLLLVGAATGLAAASYALLGHRDHGGGLVATRPGPATGSPRLARPEGLVVRLQRASLAAWAAGLMVTGISYGAIVTDVEDIIGDSEDIADIIAQAGGDLTESYVASSMLMVALITGGFAISSALRARGEETAGRAEPVLATALSRTRWLGAHVALSMVGSALIVVLAGLAMGVTYAVVAGDADQVLQVTGAALVQVPGLWVLAGAATALVGLAPRATAVAWALLAWCGVVGMLGQLLDLPGWAAGLSPFHHLPRMPVQGVAWAPVTLLSMLALGLVAAGLVGFRRRDAGY